MAVTELLPHWRLQHRMRRLVLASRTVFWILVGLNLNTSSAHWEGLGSLAGSARIGSSGHEGADHAVPLNWKPKSACCDQMRSMVDSLVGLFLFEFCFFVFLVYSLDDDEFAAGEEEFVGGAGFFRWIVSD